MVSRLKVFGATVAVAVLAMSTATTARADSGVSNGQTYGVTTTSITGSTPDNRGHWSAQVGQLSDGDTGVRDAFNQASAASARGQIDQILAAMSPDVEWSFESKSTVTFRAAAIAEVIKGVYYAKRAAHGTDSVSTVVIDSRSAKPVTLAGLFSNEQAGLNRLSEQTKLIFPQVYGGPAPMPDEQGNKPIPENFANWIPTSAGMQLHFTDYQFGHGLPVITVPWSALSDVLATDMVALTHD